MKASPRRWRADTRQARRKGGLFDAYYEWLLATNFRYYGTAEWLPLLLELHHSGPGRSTAQQFAKSFFGLLEQDDEAQAWASLVRLPTLYAQLSARFTRPLQHVSLLAHRDFLALIYRGGGPAASIRRFQIGKPLAHAKEPPQGSPGKPPALKPMQLPAAAVVSGIIDEGIAFGHDRLFADDGSTRLVAMWDQQTPSDTTVDLNYGRTFDKTQISAALTAAKHGALIDEDQLYRDTQFADHTLDGHKALAARASHGAHVADLACRGLAAPPAGLRPVVVVQLPPATVADTSGASLAPQAINALHYILQQADLLAGQGGAVLPVVANLSYGQIAGPHDGRGMLEAAVDGLVASCAGSLSVVLPAGNNRQSRCHARFSLQPGRHRWLRWRVQPDDRSESLLELYLPPGSAGLSFVVETPDGTLTTVSQAAPKQDLLSGGQVVGHANFSAAPVPGARALMQLQIAPTADPDGLLALAPAGLWRVKIDNPANGGPVRRIHAWIQRDDTAPGHAPRGRQSYFDDPDYARHDRQGRLIDADDHVLTAASVVRRDGTFNAIATGRRSIVVGGFRRSDGKPALYSGSGPVLPPRRGAPIADGPEALLPSDDAASHRGVLAAGTRSGSCVAMSGTSVAAPQAARLLVEIFAAGQVADRSKLYADAQGNDPFPAPQPLPERGGGGRLRPAAARPQR